MSPSAPYHRVLLAECSHMSKERLQPERAGTGPAWSEWCEPCADWIPYLWVTATEEEIRAAGPSRPIRQPRTEDPL